MYRDELDEISEEEDSLGKKAFDIIKTLVPAFLLVLFIRSSIAEPFVFQQTLWFPLLRSAIRSWLPSMTTASMATHFESP